MKTNLKPCPDCGHNVSKDAAACPGCGRKFHQEEGTIWVLLVVTIIGMGIAFVVIIDALHK